MWRIKINHPFLAVVVSPFDNVGYRIRGQLLLIYGNVVLVSLILNDPVFLERSYFLSDCGFTLAQARRKLFFNNFLSVFNSPFRQISNEGLQCQAMLRKLILNRYWLRI